MRAQKRENENLKKNNVLRLLEPIDYVIMFYVLYSVTL